MLTTVQKLGIAITSVAVIGFHPSSLMTQSTVHIKVATVAPKGTSLHQSLLSMGQQWRKTSGGAVDFNVYPDGVMGGEAEAVRRIRIGQLQASLLSVTGLAEIDSSASALQNLPMMFQSLDEVDVVGQKLTPDLERRFLDKGFVLLFCGDAGWVRFFSKQPMLRPADLKRLKVFTWAGDPAQSDIMKSSGYQPVPLETNDILPGLQTGLINAVPTVPLIALAGQFYGPSPHMLEINWAPLVGGMVIAKKTWDSFPEAWQEAFRKAAKQAGDEVRQRSRAENDESVTAMQKRGLTVHRCSPEQEQEWRKAAEDVYPKIRGSIVPADMFDQVQRILQEYRASKKAAK